MKKKGRHTKKTAAVPAPQSQATTIEYKKYIGGISTIAMVNFLDDITSFPDTFTVEFCKANLACSAADFLA